MFRPAQTPPTQRARATAPLRGGCRRHDATHFVAYPLNRTEERRSNGNRMTTTSAYPIKDVLPRLLEGLQRRAEGRHHPSGVTTGLNRLDELTGGLQNGDLIVIGGRPSMGKTALTCQIALHAAFRLDVPVIYFSMDLRRERLAMRLTATVARVDLQHLRTGRLDTEAWNRVEAAERKLSRVPLYIDDTAASAGDLCARSRHAATESGIGLVVVDFLQAIRPHEIGSRSEAPLEPSTALKHLAVELGVPVIAVSQLNRRVEHRSPQYPRLSDLRGSSAIENDADLVMFLYREDVYWPHTPREGTADITIAKHRNGPTGTVWTMLKPEMCLFEAIL